ncbi:MAG: hypothetical protein HY058_16270 [Proteobacteria bacterium]|nr:hypothetical protein [Pseudomonadota bacterium]
MPRRSVLVGCSVLLVTGFALGHGGGAAAEMVDAPGGLALGGYDVVAYFTDDKPVRGLAEFASVFQSVTYRFRSAANRDRFLADPLRYLPAYGGYSAYGVANGVLAPGDPEQFAIVEGRLYVNFSKSVHSQWLRDPAFYIARADQNWLTLR